jgi:hypothetical protein
VRGEFCSRKLSAIGPKSLRDHGTLQVQVIGRTILFKLTLRPSEVNVPSWKKKGAFWFAPFGWRLKVKQVATGEKVASMTSESVGAWYRGLPSFR